MCILLITPAPCEKGACCIGPRCGTRSVLGAMSSRTAPQPLPTYVTLVSGAVAGVVELMCLYPLGRFAVLMQTWSRRACNCSAVPRPPRPTGLPRTAASYTRSHALCAMKGRFFKGLSQTWLAVSRDRPAAPARGAQARDQVWVRSAILTRQCKRLLGQSVPAPLSRARPFCLACAPHRMRSWCHRELGRGPV